MKIGADPEFLLLDKYKNVKPADSVSFFHHCGSSYPIGCDGAGTPVEIRPSPSSIKNINHLCKNIDKLLEKIAFFTNQREYTLISGAGRYKESGFTSIGGHIHFGYEAFTERTYLNKANRAKLVHHLDNYLTPLQCMCIKEEDNRRRMGGYGGLGATRGQPYGFEYRTPYSFIISPFFIKAWFSLAALIANNYKIKKDNTLHNDIEDYYGSSSKKHLLDKNYPKIKKRILKMMHYNSPNQKQNSNIISLFSLIEQKKKYKSFNVLNSFDLNKIMPDEIVKDIKIFYLPDEYMDKIALDFKIHGYRMIKIKVGRKPRKNDIVLYGLNDKKEEPKRVMKISPNLMKLCPTTRMTARKRSGYDDYKTIYITKQRSPYKNGIGISHYLRKEFATSKLNVQYFVDQIKKYKRYVLDYV